MEVLKHLGRLQDTLHGTNRWISSAFATSRPLLVSGGEEYCLTIAPMSSDLSYPIGRFSVRMVTTAETRREGIEDIAALPVRMRDALAGLNEAQLDTPYRPQGWTVRRLVHHVADSHMNGYIRLKLALTEDNPTIKPYEQAEWAELSDSRLPVALSLGILDGVHARWTALWRAMTEEDFQRTFNHPELGPLTTHIHAHLYGWHSRHHVAHITALRQREGW
jgi:hypothetical protein